MTAVELRDVTKRFGDLAPVTGLSLAVESGSLHAIVGPSGCGKTTLLRLIAGLERPDQGVIVLNGAIVSAAGTYVPPHLRDVGFAFQDFALWPHKTVAGHLDFVLRARKIPRARRRGDVNNLLRVVGLVDKRSAYPATLSGGQQQRLAIARAFAGAPSLLLLDEPFANLDTGLRERLSLEILDRKSRGATVIIAVHDLDDSLPPADAVIEFPRPSKGA